MAIQNKNYNDENWFQKLFISEAKAAIDAKNNSQGSGGGSTPSGPIETITDIFPSQLVEGFVEDPTFNGAYSVNSPVPFEIKEGETYYVEWDGETFTCVGALGDFGGMAVMYLGNNTLLGGSSDEPFTMGYYVDLAITGFIAEEGTSHTIRVYQKTISKSADPRIKFVDFMYGDTYLGDYPVIVGDTCKCPVNDTGDIEPPTKEQTESTVYTFGGWSKEDDGTVDSDALTNVTEDRKVYAVFDESAREYVANFYDDSGNLMETQLVGYGDRAIPPSTVREDYDFSYWTPSDLTITGNTDFHGTWEYFPGWAMEREVSADMTDIYNYAAYSEDGTRFVIIASSKNIYVYDATTKPYTRLLSTTLTTSIQGTAISPDGKLLAVITTKSTTLSRTLRIYNIEGSSFVQVYEKIPTSITSGSSIYSYSPKFYIDGDKTKFSVRYDNSLYEFVVDETTSPWEFTTVYTNMSRTINFNPDKTMGAAVGLMEGETNKTQPYIYDVVNGYADVTSTYIPTFTSTGYKQAALTYSPDGRYLVFTCKPETEINYPYSSLKMRVYDTTTTPYTVVKEVVEPYSGNRYNPGTPFFSTSGHLFIVPRLSGNASESGKPLEVYDTRTWELLELPSDMPQGDIRAACYHKDDYLFVHVYYSSGYSKLYKVKGEL